MIIILKPEYFRLLLFCYYWLQFWSNSEQSHITFSYLKIPIAQEQMFPVVQKWKNSFNYFQLAMYSIHYLANSYSGITIIDQAMADV